MSKVLTLVAVSLLLGGCLDEINDDSDNDGAVRYFAAVATVAPDFSSGAHSLIGREDGLLVAHNDITPASHSDITIAAHGANLYRIERFAGANVTRFAGNGDVTTPVWQFSVVAAGDTAGGTNPSNMAFASETKAYIPLYGKDKVLIVNPSAATASEFITGELDLSAYDDGDGVPQIHNVLVADGRLFVTMQRLDAGFVPSNPAYLAVFDVASDTEIDTGRDPMLNGIALAIRNPDNDLLHVPADNAVYVQGSGKIFDFDMTPVQLTGGVERIDLDDYSSRVVVDDDAAGATHGHTLSAAVVSPTRGYIVAGGFFSSTLYPFDPATGIVGAAANPTLTGVQLSDISTGPQGMLWVSDQSNATVHLLDPADNSIVDAVVTNLNPAQVVFYQ